MNLELTWLMRLIFVGGCERSGTSLVQKILASHGRIAGGPELVFTGRIAELYGRMAASYPPEYSTRLDAYYDQDSLAAAFRSLFQQLLQKVAQKKPTAIYFSEKTPSNIFQAEHLLEIFPDSLFIHVLRDGRAVLASHRAVQERLAHSSRRRSERADLRLRRVCARWLRAVEMHFQLCGQENLAARYLPLKYEELQRDPESQLDRLFDFLKLDVEPQARTPEQISSEALGLPIDGIWMTPEMAQQGFEPSRIDRWRRSLPFPDRLLAELLMAASLKRLAYPVSGASLRVNQGLQWLGIGASRPAS